MIAWLPDWTDGAARDLGVIAAIVVAVGVLLTKTPLGRIIRYAYRHLFGEPVSEWLRRVIRSVVDPIVGDLSNRNDAQHAENAQRLEHIEQRVAVVEAHTAVHAERLTNGSARMDLILTELGGLKNDVSKLRTPPVPLAPPSIHQEAS